MRKNICILAVLVAYPACAQVVSGTVIVINRTENQFIVAADSRATGRPLLPVLSTVVPPNDSYCKIRAFKHQIIFAAVGSPEVQSARAGLNAFDEARKAVSDAKPASGDVHIEELANNWCARMKSKWNDIERENFLAVMDAAKTNRGPLTGGIFAEAYGGKIYSQAAQITFNDSPLSIPNPIECSLIELAWMQCGQKEGEAINIDGRADIAINFCSERKPDTKIAVRTPLKAADRNTELAVQLVEMTIDASKDGDVGGHVNAVTITKDGRITWNSNSDCPENED